MRNKLNVMGNAKNPFQKDFKKVLCVCSAGLLRSPTAAVVLSQEPYNFNTRACGLVEEYALVPFDEVLAYWADEIVCMEESQEKTILRRLEDWDLDVPVKCLKIVDSYSYRDPKLVQMIKERYE